MSARNPTRHFPRNHEEVVRSYQSLFKKVNRLRAMVDKLDAALDVLQLELAEILKEANAPLLVSFDSARPSGNPENLPAIGDILQAEAEKGVEKFDFNRHADGKVTAIINGVSVRLPPVLGEFLIILADPAPTRIDPQPTVLISWKEAEEVRMAMQLRRDRPFSRGNVWNCVNKLRNCLSRALLNPHLIQTNREKGLVRFALRRTGYPR